MNESWIRENVREARPRSRSSSRSRSRYIYYHDRPETPLSPCVFTTQTLALALCMYVCMYVCMCAVYIYILCMNVCIYVFMQSW